MRGYQDRFTFGSIQLPNNILYAPLSGCSDYPFRRLIAEYRPGLMFCEMVKMDALIRKDRQSLKMLDFAECMRPIGAQLFGSNPIYAEDCAKMIEDIGFDVLDFNCGCPVKKVVKDGSGASMLLDLHKIEEVLQKLVKAVSIPVTIKIRAGWDSQHLFAKEIMEIARNCGAAAITIHGRTRAQGYSGKADRKVIGDVKAQAKDILVIGNGDIFSESDAKDIFSQTDCDGIMLARGALSKPWLIEDIRKGKDDNKSFFDLRPILLKHFSYILEYQEPKRALFDFRRAGFWYLKNF